MAISNLYTVNTGTATTGDILTYNTTSSAWTSSTWTIETVIKIKTTKLSVNVPAKPAIIKDFWDGVKWKEHTSYWPRKSITGKIIIGKMHKRHRKVVIRGSTTRIGNVINTVLSRTTPHTQYAKTKELFTEKLKGNT